jgi:hypothetical protein
VEVLLPLPDALTYAPRAPAPPSPVGLLPLPELRAFETLAEGGTVAEAAAAAGVHRNTAARWAAPGGRVGRELLLLRAEQAGAARARLVALSGLAVEVLRDVMTDPEASAAARVRAACAVLDRAGLGPCPEPVAPPEPELTPGDVTARLAAVLTRCAAVLRAVPDATDADPEDEDADPEDEDADPEDEDAEDVIQG